MLLLILRLLLLLVLWLLLILLLLVLLLLLWLRCLGLLLNLLLLLLMLLNLLLLWLLLLEVVSWSVIDQMRNVASNSLAMAQRFRVRNDLRTSRLLAHVLLGCWQWLRSLYIVLLAFDLRRNRMADQLLRRENLVSRSMVKLSRDVALLLAIILDVLGNVSLVLGYALDEFTTRWQNVLQVALMLGGGRLMIRSASGSQIGSGLLHQPTLNRAGEINKVAANRRLGLWLRLRTIFRESGHLWS